MPNINYGWFFTLSESAPIPTPITGLSGSDWEVGFTAIKASQDDGAKIYFSGGQGDEYRSVDRDVSFRKAATQIAIWRHPHWKNIPYHTTLRGEAASIRLDAEGHSGLFSESNGGTNVFFDIRQLGIISGNTNPFQMSKLKARTVSTDTIKADWDGNKVLNAAGTDFILRTEANANPTLADSGYELKLYDVSGNNNHVTLPASTTWQFISSVTLPTEVVAGSTGNVFEAPVGFTVEDVTIGGYSVPFTFNQADGTGTFDAPDMGDTVAGFPLFGETTQIQLIDNTNGNTAEVLTRWIPPSPYSYATFISNPDNTKVNNAYYQWSDPPLAGHQAIFDASKYTINSYGSLSVVTTEPSFEVTEYLNDGDLKAFQRSSSKSGEAPFDTTKPQISIPGENPLTIQQNSTFTAPTATVTDNGAQIGAVEGTGTVDTATPGEYTITYPGAEFVDSAGNVADDATLTVIVEEAAAMAKIDITSGTGLEDGDYRVMLWSGHTTNDPVIYDNVLPFVDGVASVTGLDAALVGQTIYGVAQHPTLGGIQIKKVAVNE
ncbi:DUF5011 domain-containing protein [Alteromonas pelagimontana]|uniref:DUF5011 domain-containing protein n=1 Tax=Alteromonas pelagimontana TaxID=1858656 RepID=A0A6M4MAJ9_9ALTE|nr:immunoglobulin-like domain-containing protein [Alteromonas pelagimontana]QJR79595.1 DUF5011 domain-containing protein [Alteromonas pelagimontana]